MNIQNVYRNPDLIKRHTATRESFEEIGVIIGKNGHYDASNYDVIRKWSDFEKRGPNRTFQEFCLEEKIELDYENLFPF